MSVYYSKYSGKEVEDLLDKIDELVSDVAQLKEDIKNLLG